MHYKSLITAPELFENLDSLDIRIIDARFYLGNTEQGQNEYNHSHIPGAVYAHLDKDLSGKVVPGKTGRHPLPSKSRFRKKVGEWGITADTQVIVYDQSHGGIASRLWWMMNWLGHDRVAVLDGGWNLWVRKGKPVTPIIPDVKTIIYPELESLVKVVNREAIKDMINKQDYSIVDARNSERYRGENEPIDPIAGHITSAVNLPFIENAGEDGQWKSSVELKQRFRYLVEKYGADHISVYCGSGVTACHNLLAFRHAGLPIPLLYAGSWSEWILDADNPKEPSG